MKNDLKQMVQICSTAALLGVFVGSFKDIYQLNDSTFKEFMEIINEQAIAMAGGEDNEKTA